MTVSQTTSTAGAVLSVDDMLANAKRAAGQESSAGKSAVEKLLEAHGEAGSKDTVELSPVAKLLAAEQKSNAAKATPYTDQDWYIRAKVAQLKGQIALYSTLPGLDPSGGVINSITKEVNDLVKKQQDKLKAVQDDAKAKQAELAKQQANAYHGVSADDMLSRSKSIATTGKLPDAPLSQAVQDMLDKAKVDMKV